MEQRNRIRKHIDVIRVTRQTLPVLVDHARRANSVQVVHPQVLQIVAHHFEVEDARLADLAVTGG